ncbi:MAG: hypothetical protein OSB47_14880, partial [Pirellulaceae bacterium]|nr:hypothetical protein [Pirellulaceae bacterium]
MSHHCQRKHTCSGLTLLTLVLATAALQAGDWPQWRGPNRNGHATSEGLRKEWPKDGPTVRWQVNHVGVGYSSLAIAGDRIVTQGDLNGVEHVICLSAKDGKVLWTVQPGPLATLLAERINQELQRLDKDKNGAVSELEALAGFGWRFNDYDQPTADSDASAAALAVARTARVFTGVDKDGDNLLSFSEANAARIDRFTNIDVSSKQADPEALAQQRAQSLLKVLDKDKDQR